MPRPGEDRSDVGGAAQFNNIGPVPLSALIVEVDDDPEHAVSDGSQTITPSAFAQMMSQCRRVAEAVDQTI